MAKEKKTKLSLEELLEEAIVKEEDTPHEVPENWAWTKLHNIVSICTGKKDANYGTENGKYCFFTCAAEPIRCDGYSFEGESILLAGNGANVGLALYYDGKFEAYQRTYIIQTKHEICLKYIFYHFKGFWKDYNHDKQYGSATNYIKLGNFQTYPIPIPPFVEQQRIVEIIESLFEKLDSAKELVQNALDSFENRKAAILHKAFTGELTAKWREENGVSLDEWEDTLLSKVVNGFKYGISEKSDASNTGMPVIRIPNVISNEIDFSDMKYLNHFDVTEENLIKENDILIIRSNGSRELVGKCALVGKLYEQYTFASYLIRIRPCNIDSHYLLYLLNSSYVRKQFFDKSKSSAGINNINSKELGSLKIPLPLMKEQKEIVRILNNLLENEQQAKELSDVIEKIDLMKKSILARAFRGELGTNNPDEESAVELLKEVLKEKI